MIIMNVKLNNLCAFKDFHINFSYPKKILNSTIENEFLPDFPNFRYRKLNILMGTNASGKTSLGKMFKTIFSFIRRKELVNITDSIADVEKESYFLIDFIPDKTHLCRVEVNIPPKVDEEYSIDRCKISIKWVKIKKEDSYERCAKKIDLGKEIMELNGLEGLEKFSNAVGFGWYFTYPLDSNYYSNNIKIGDLENALYLKILKNTLMTLDNSIVNVIRVKDIDNTYAIVMDNKKLIIQEGELLDPNNILSSGTKAGIDIADLLTSIIEHKNGFYYCDEKFSYIHSDIERAILSVMISKLKDGEQLFFTTHNLDIVDMNLPKHSFWFMKKVNNGGNISIACESASNKLKKPTDSVRNALENDVFAAAPRLELLYDLEDID